MIKAEHAWEQEFSQQGQAQGVFTVVNFVNVRLLDTCGFFIPADGLTLRGTFGRCGD